MELYVGMEYVSETVVDESNTALAIGSGDLPVLATPAMVALMENAAMNAVAPCLTGEQTTVGGHINVVHLAPTKMGESVHAKALLKNVEGRKLTFEVCAFQDEKLIGEGTHVRFMVDRGRFMK